MFFPKAHHEKVIEQNLHIRQFDSIMAHEGGYTYTIKKAPGKSGKYVVRVLEPGSHANWTRTMTLDAVLDDILGMFGSVHLKWVAVDDDAA